MAKPTPGDRGDSGIDHQFECRSLGTALIVRGTTSAAPTQEFSLEDLRLARTRDAPLRVGPRSRLRIPQKLVRIMLRL